MTLLMAYFLWLRMPHRLYQHLLALHGFKVHQSWNHVKHVQQSGGVIGVAEFRFSAGESQILVRLRK